MADRRAYNAEATRKRILAAAEHEFSCYGFHGARIDRIARHSKANKGMIYVYYGNKKKLYRRVFLENYRKVLEQEELLTLTEKDIPLMTEKVLNCYFAFHTRNPQWWRILAWENLDPGAGINTEELRQLSGHVMQHLADIYHRGQQQGYFRKEIDFSTYIFNLMAASFFYRSNMATMSGTLSPVFDQEHRREALREQMIMIVQQGVINR